MSIVEKALKKLTDSAAAHAAGPASPRIVPAPVPLPTEPAKVRRVSDKVVEIDANALRAAGLMGPAQQERQLAHQYRQVKRPLLANAFGRGIEGLSNAQLIMIASAVPGEGKTFTTMNLALSLTRERDLKVVLVDADVAKPHISRVLGVESDLGLLDALQDSALDVESLVLPTTNPSLSVLPAGKRSENATELLASSRMDEIAKRLMQVDANRVVIIDSPPILLTTESHALANVAGQIVVVVRADSTPRNTVLDALSHVGNHPGVSLLLNQTSTGSNTGNYYHYGYDEKGLNAGQT